MAMGLWLSLLLLLAWSPLHAATYHVSKSGSNSNSCLTAQSPGSSAKLTINGALPCLQPGDTLLVGNGLYTESLFNTIPGGTSWAAPVTLRAQTPLGVTIRPNVGADRVLHFQGTSKRYIIIDGFVLDSINATYDAVKITWAGTNQADHASHIRIINSDILNSKKQGVLGGMNSEFINLRVYNNGSNDFDHGFYLGTPGNLIENCEVFQNSGWGIHIYAEGKSVAHNNIVRNNRVYHNARTGQRGVGILLGSGNGNIAYNNVVYGNKGGISVGFSTPQNVRLWNNTLYGNTTFGIEMRGTSNLEIRNNIILQASGPTFTSSGFTNPGLVRSHNLCGTGTTGDGCLAGNPPPQFVNPSSANFQLQASSPAINAGTTIASVTHDILGVSRPQGAAYDIGAYEVAAALPPPQPDPGTLVASYNFDENTDVVANDASGRGHTATLGGDATWGAPIHGLSSLQVGGAGFAQASGTTALRPPSAFGLAAWINMTGTDTNGCDVVSMGDSYALRIMAAGQLACFFYNGNTWIQQTSTAQVTTGANEFVACSYQHGDGLRLWRGTTQVDFLAASGTISYTLGSHLQIGRHGAGHTAYDCTGRIDSVRVYDGYLTQEAVNNLFAEDVPVGGTVAAVSQWTQANAPQGVFLGTTNQARSHQVNVPLGLRYQIRHTGSGVNTHVGYQCAVDGGAWTTVANTFEALGIRYHPDTASGQGDLTAVLLDPDGGLTHRNGYVMASSTTPWTVEASWEASPDPTVEGYRLYYGTTSGVYPTTVDTVLATSTQVQLAPDTTYYFTVTASNSVGESAFAPEVSFATSADEFPVLTLAHGDVAEIEARLAFQANLAGTTAQCRPIGLDSYGDSVRTLTLTAPLHGLTLRGVRADGVGN